MTRIVGGGGKAPAKSVGRPGFSKIRPGGIRRGNKILRVSRQPVRRLFARDPKKANAIIGTAKDVLGSVNQRFNLAPENNPRIVRAASKPQLVGRALAKAGIRNRSANRRIERRAP